MAANDHQAHVPGKGYDDSPPRNGIIFFYTVLAIVLLGVVDVLLDSYFAKVMDTEVHDKVLTRGFERVQEQRAKELEALEKSGISDAKRAIATRGRNVSPTIAPESGAGKAAIGGWSQLKREEPPAAAAAEPTNSANASPQPANPNAAEVKPVQGSGAPAGRSPVAPGNRAAPAEGADR